MRVELLPFGMMKEFFAATSLELPAGASVGDLLETLSQGAPSQQAAGEMLRRVAVSVNAEYAQPARVLRDGDVVGLLPPVSGGSGAVPGPIEVSLTREPIPVERWIAKAKQGSDGAVVVFDGFVRDNTRGRRTLHLDYEAYDEMAEARMAAIAAQAVDRFGRSGVRAVTLVHRLGRLQVGETSVLIVVASAHRAAAFDACRWLIDTLKTTVPIWKRETFEDGAVWAEGEPFPAELAAGRSLGTPEPSLEPPS